MSKQSLSSSLRQANMIDDSESNPFIEWLSKNKSTILLTFVSLFTLMILAYRFVTVRTVNAETEFFQAQNDYSRLQEKAGISQDTNDLASLERLEATLKSYPELQAKYDSSLAQLLIIDGNPTLALPFAERTFKRVGNDHVDFYESYAQTSLLISEKNYEAALSSAYGLKEKLKEASSKEFGTTLYVFNLIRLAILHQQLNQPNQEKQIWDELVGYQGNVEAMAAVHQLFREGNFSLSHYVDSRKKALTP